MSSSDTRPGMRRLFVLVVVVATACAYLPVLDAGFVWDDSEYVVDNQTLEDLDGLRRIWLEPRANSQYYPLVYSSFWLEHQLWDLRPTGYHAINVLLHAVNALLIWMLLRKLSLSGAWLAALIFALHPVHVESVAWITERKNVLSSFFYLSAALFYLRFRTLAVVPPPGPRRYYALALAFFVCALLSKSVTASLPAVFLIVIYWKTGRVGARDVLLLLPFFALGVVAGLHTAWLEQVHVGASRVDWDLTLVERWLIASRALCFYAAKLLWPAPLTFSYPRWDIDAGRWWQYSFGAAVIACVVLLWSGRRRLGRGPLVAFLFFAGTLLPALGFINVYPMRFSYVADHFQYLASLGVIAPFAAGAAGAVHAIEPTAASWGRWIWRASVGIILVALATLTFCQSRIYRDEETLWRDTLSKNPRSWLAHNNLGRIFGFRGEHGLAMQHFRRAVELEPEYYVAETNLAGALIQLGRYDEAVDHLRHALQLEPTDADAHFFLWVALSHLGQWDEAVAHLRRDRALKPSFERHLEAARLLRQAGRYRDALLEIQSAEKFRPSSAAIPLARGRVYMALGQPARAAEAYREAVARRPGRANAHYRLGLALERLGDVSQARQHFSEAVRLNPDHEPARRKLERLTAGDRGGAAPDLGADEAGPDDGRDEVQSAPEEGARPDGAGARSG